MSDSVRKESIDTLARTIWGEARNQSHEGMVAVANVVMNRVNNPRWWGKDVISVCKAPRQFSCWNKDDPNLPLLLRVTRSDERFVKCLEIAEKAVDGQLADVTKGADHYYNPAVVNPRWASPSKVTVTIGDHVFLRLEVPAPRSSVMRTNTANATTVMTGAGLAAVATASVPVVESLSKLQPMVAIAIIIVAAVGVIVWRIHKSKEEG